MVSSVAFNSRLVLSRFRGVESFPGPLGVEVLLALGGVLTSVDFGFSGVIGEVGAVGGLETIGLSDETCDVEETETESIHRPASRASSEFRTPLVSEPAPPQDSSSVLETLFGPELNFGPEEE